MCGIAGVFNYGSGWPVDRALIETMTCSLGHRGPDDEGFHFDGSLALGMRRLSIIDLAGGAQPISNETGTVHVVVNGEIYNFHELRLDLEARGHRFRSHSDSEVAVHAFEHLDLVDRLCAADSACSRYFKPEAIRMLVADHRSGRQDNNRALFSLLTFELWHERFIRPGPVALRAPQPIALEGIA